MKDTKLIKIEKRNIDSESLDQSSKIIRSGGLVAFPTETVYGLGANALDPEAVKSIFEAKGRPSDNPLIVHIWDVSQLDDLVAEVSGRAKLVIDEFWPGPLTILFEKSEKIPMVTSGGLDTVAIRMPDSEIALEILKNADIPVAAPSANTSGRPSPTNAEHVLEDLDGRIDMVIDGGSTGLGLESTVLDLTSDIPTILRPGGVTYEELTNVLGLVEYDPAIETGKSHIVPKSPGQKYRHYSPIANMEIFSGDMDSVVREINKKHKVYTEDGLKVGVMASDETIQFYNFGNVLTMGSRKKLDNIAANLFHVLREFDKLDVDLILSEGVEEIGIGKAIMNRMKKAAGENITYLE